MTLEETPTNLSSDKISTDSVNTINSVSTTPKKSNIPFVLMSILFLAAAGAASYYYFFPLTPAAMTDASATPTPTPIASADPTSNWQTYSNSKYNFSFKYPSNLVDKGAVSGPFTGKSVSIRSFSDPDTIREGTDAPFDGFSVFFVTEQPAENPESYISGELKAMQTSAYASMANATEVKLTQPNKNSVALVDGNRAYYYLYSDAYDKLVVISYSQTNDQFKETFDQILSTFKFTDAVK